jgi:hypothetical protein
VDEQIEPKWWLGKPWIIALACLLISGIAFFFSGLSSRTLSIAAPAIPYCHWGRMLGVILISIALTHLTIHTVDIWLHKQLGLKIKKKESDNFNYFIGPALIGMTESVLYPIVLLIDAKEFIPAWIALKMVGNWRGWQRGDDGRRRVHKFLINSGLSIMAGAVAYGAILILVISD